MPLLTLSTLSERAYDRVDQNTLLYPQSQITAFVNEGIQVLNCLTGFYQQNVPLPYTTQQSRVWYDVPLPIVIMTRCQIDGQFIRRSTLLQLARSKPDWVQDNTANQMSSISSWGTHGLTKFFLHPADAIGGQQVVVTGVVNPPTLVNPTDSILAPNWLQSAFDLYCSCSITLKESSALFGQQSKDLVSFYKLVKKYTTFRGLITPRYWVTEIEQPTKRG